MAQQSHENQSSFDLVEILNVSNEDREESWLNILLEEVLTADVIEETTVGDDKIGKVPGS